MPRVAVAYLRAADTHDFAAAFHERAADLLDKRGNPTSAARERERARVDRADAVADREQARLCRERDASRLR